LPDGEGCAAGKTKNARLYDRGNNKAGVKMNKPLLSIVIANYNYGRFLEAAIKSVVEQDGFDQCELIIVDGGSTDNSVEIIKKYEDKTIKEYINDKRLKKAAELLSVSKYNITEISSMVGFNNVTYFSKMFKKLYGVSPSEYKDRKTTM
jgi:cellulose synthase/poly-beta-1,6-N-acetylglucosamine synthase-like glycosyltransferase